MNLITFIRIIKDNSRLLITVPLLVTLLVYILVDKRDKTYFTSSTIYTGFASGYSITDEGRKDFFAIKTKFDNFFQNAESRATKEEIVLEVLAHYLAVNDSGVTQLNEQNTSLLEEEIGVELMDSLRVRGNFQRTFSNIRDYYYSDYSNKLYTALNTRESQLFEILSINMMGNLEIAQEGSSDLVRLKYESTDPGLTYLIMTKALSVILKRAKNIKYAESGDIVGYFEAEVAKAKDRLDKAEAELGVLMTKNNITNYYEQTKWLASRNEDFEVAFQEEKLGLAAALAAEKQAEVAMGISSGIKVKSSAVVELRQQYKEFTDQLMKEELNQSFSLAVGDSGKKKVSMKAIEQKRNEVEIELEKELDQLLQMKNTATGIQIEDVANRWLKAVIEVEEYEARIQQFIQFEKEFEKTYSRFSRLGSRIKQFERKIDVCERDYLVLLKSLNDSRMKQENVNLGANMKIIDEPFYPVEPELSKNSVMVLLGAFSTFLLLVSLLTALELIDKSIKTGERLAELTGTENRGAIPLLGLNLRKEEEEIVSKVLDQIIGQILCESREILTSGVKRPMVVGVASCISGEGKSTVINLISNRMEVLGYSTLAIYTGDPSWKDKGFTNNNGANHFVSEKVTSQVSLDEFVSDAQISREEVDYILVELSPLNGSLLPIQLCDEIDLLFFMSQANRVWREGDNFGLGNLRKIFPAPIYNVINGVRWDQLETILGELPKKRSKLRVAIKKFMLLNFNNNS